MNLTTVESFFSAAYLEDYLDCVENLPDDLQRNISYMRELDVTYQDILHDLESHQSNLSRDTDGAGRKKTLIHIQRGLIRSQEIGDEKLQIIQQILDLVENKSRQLDVDYRNISLRSTYGKDQENSEPSSRGGGIGGGFGGGGDIQPERSSKRARRQRNDCGGINSIRDEQLLLSSGVAQHHLSQYAQQVQQQQNQQQPQSQQQQQQHHSQQRETKEQNQKEQHREQHGERQTTTSATTTAAAAAASAAADDNKGHHHVTSSGGGGSGGWGSSSNAAASKKTKKKKRKSKTTDKDHHQGGGGGQNYSQQQHSTNRGGDSPIDLQPIDPDEPTYCLCQQISYGEMIGCDNDRCPIEWFHFSCVALTTKPKGKWYCPKCRGDRPNVMKPMSRN